MPLAEQQKELYAFALEKKFILPAFNFYDLESMRAILDAAEEADSPVIAQISLCAYQNIAPVAKFIAFVREAAEDYSIPVLLHHDYLPGLEECRHAVDMGFQSVSLQGTSLTYEENIRITAQVVEYAHAHGAIAEAELGNVPGEGFPDGSVYTDPGQAADFVGRTGCDALAVSVGTAHGGLRKAGRMRIDYELLDRIRRETGGIPLILHGAASRPRSYTDLVNLYGGSVEYLNMAAEEDIAEAGNHGVAKIYADMDNWLSVTGALRRFYAEKPEIFNPVQYMPVTGRAMKEAVKHKMEYVAKSAGHGKEWMRRKARGKRHEAEL